MSFADMMARRVLGIPTVLWVLGGAIAFYAALRSMEPATVAPQAVVSDPTIAAGPAPGWAIPRPVVTMPAALSGAVFSPHPAYLNLGGA